MNDILTIINELGINKQFMPIIYILLLIAIVYKHFMSFKHDIKRNRINKLKEVYDFNEHDENTKKFLKYSLSEEYFKLLTGLSFSFGQQEKLMELYLKNKASVAFYHYKRVAKYFKFDDDQNIVSIKIPPFAEFIGWCLTIVGIFLLEYSSLFLYKLFTIQKIENSYGIWVGIGFVMLFSLMFLFGLFCTFKPYFIYKSSTYINKQIGSPDFTCCYHRALTKKFHRLPFYILIPLFGQFLTYLIYKLTSA